MKYRVVICGAGRIGAGYGGWADEAYTHAGAIKANSDRADLIAFIEPNPERAEAASRTWKVPTYDKLSSGSTFPDIVCIATQPEDQAEVFRLLPSSVKGIYCEKPYWAKKTTIPTQVNYTRRADPIHREITEKHLWPSLTLSVQGKLDHHTLCHFEDLARWWKAKQLIYKPFDGPCSYYVDLGSYVKFFDNGGVDGGECMKLMFANLLDHLEGKADLFSPAR